MPIAPILPPIKEQDVAAFESRNHLKLPADYRRFLLKSNGGRPKPNRSTIPDMKEPVLVDVLYGITTKRGLGLQIWLDEYRDEMPPEFLVIGADPGGAFFILGPKGPDGGVYLWDHQHRYAGSSADDGNTFQLAPSFTAWLKSLS